MCKIPHDDVNELLHCFGRIILNIVMSHDNGTGCDTNPLALNFKIRNTYKITVIFMILQNFTLKIYIYSIYIQTHQNAYIA